MLKPYLADLEVESMKKFILDHKRFSQKCLRLFLNNNLFWRSSSRLSAMKKASLNKRREKFIQVMLHQANSSRKWGSMKWGSKWNCIYHAIHMSNSWRILSSAHRLPEKETVRMFVSGLNPEIFRKEIYSWSFETLVDVMAKTRHELSSYRDIVQISERIKRPKVTKSQTIGLRNHSYPENHEATPRILLGRHLRRTRKYLARQRQWILKMSSVSCVARKDTMLRNARTQRIERVSSRSGC